MAASMTPDPLHTGGCQCGAVRYAVHSEPFNPHICHCRMCQKASGNLFQPFAAVELLGFAWTRGNPGIFKSSAAVERGFCRACGTPLSFRNVEDTYICLTIGSFDNPAAMRPALQVGTESRMPWFGDLAGLPQMTTEQSTPPEDMHKLASRQHPDFDE
jgi:hypothetical protein